MSTWQEQAACRPFPYLWDERPYRACALHICRTHCPVLADCAAAAELMENVEVVIGGHAYGSSGKVLAATERAKGVGEHNVFCGHDDESEVPVRQRVRVRKKREA